MSLRGIVDRLEAGFARLVLWLVRRVGPATASNIGGALARAIGPLLPVSRVADANLRLAMPELDAAARQRIVRGVWDNLGRTATEFAHVPDLQRTASGPGWEIEGEEVLRDVVARGGPMILVSGHYGNWEVLPLAVAAFGIRMSSFYRPASNALVDRMILDLRRAVVGDVPNFAKGSGGARAAMAHLRKGRPLGVLVDQKLNDGIPAPFFGHMAMTAPATAALALRFGCPVIAGRVDRLGPARFRLTVEPPLPLPNSGDRPADIARLTADINAVLERWIRARPDHWLWLHRRWPKQAVPPG
jgi:KDO2-lipid IV(A) lauroyltransferase